MKTLPNFPVDRIDEILANPERFRLLEEMPDIAGAHLVMMSPAATDLQPIVFVDFETTGVDPATDRAIQLGMARGLYSPSARRLLSIGETFCAFEDPGFPIPLEASDVNGVSDADVAGHRFDDQAVTLFLDGDPIMVAHNAPFDRAFWDRRFPELSRLRWACSLKGVDWRRLDYEGSGLGPIVMQAGAFFTGHKALDDCLAVAFMMHAEPDAFFQLLASADALTYTVEATDAPFLVKDELSKRRYRWDATRRVWYREGVVDLEAELVFLDCLYRGARTKAVVRMESARERFKKALPGLVVA